MRKESVRGKFFRVRDNPGHLFLITSHPDRKDVLIVCDETDEVEVARELVWKWIDKKEWIIQSSEYKLR